MLFVVVWAVSLDIRVLNLLDEMKEKTQTAFQLLAVAKVEDMEARYAEHFEHEAEQTAETLQAQAQTYYQQSETESVYGERNRIRGEYFAGLAAQDQEEANEMFESALQDDRLRVEILKNMSIDQQEQERLVNDLRKVNDGVCHYKLIGWFCDIIGGAADLQREADDEYIKIQRQWGEEQEVSRREFMESLVASTLQGQATSYNRTATELLNTALYWESRSKVDYALATKYNMTAASYAEAAKKMEDYGEKDLVWERSNLSLAEDTFAQAEAKFRRGIVLAFIASVEAIVALAFFGTRSLMKFFVVGEVVKKWTADTRTTKTDLYRCVAYSSLHVLMFFLCTGLIGKPMAFLTQYVWRERAALIIWFGFFAGTMQTFFLHVLPHVLVEWPTDANDRYHIGKHGLLRLIFLSILFGLEMLSVVVFWGSTVLSLRVVSFFGMPIVIVVIFGSFLSYLYVFEPRYPAIADDHSTMSTLLSESTDDESTFATPSEITPLASRSPTGKASLSSTSSSVAVRALDLSRGARFLDATDLQSLVSMNSDSPYYVNAELEWFYVGLAFDLFLVLCLAGVLFDCLPLACYSLIGKIVLTMCLVTLLALLFCVAGVFGLDLSSSRGGKVLPRSDEHIEIVSV